MWWQGQDQIGNHISISMPPKRIICLVPSITELLADLGLEAEVVGITKFCEYPQTWFRTKTRIGGTKQIHIDKIAALQPDLIIANKEENVQAQVAACSEICPVFVSDIKNLNDVRLLIELLGQICDRNQIAQDLIQQFDSAYDSLNITKKTTVAYLIWNNPIMLAGGDTFINEMLSVGGFINVFAAEMRYPSITIEDLQEKKIDYLFLSSEPYPFKDKDLDYFKKHLPNTTVLLVDGTYFSWYGSRIIPALDYIKTLRTELGLN